MAVKVGARSKHVPQVQDILTEFGCNIRTRVGFHETSETECSTDGFIIMQLSGKDEEIKKMYDALNSIDEVKATFIEF
jgi:hypothetical protein